MLNKHLIASSIFLMFSLNIGIVHSQKNTFIDVGVARIDVTLECFTVCASHTHSGPQIGNFISHFNEPLDPDELAEIVLPAMDLEKKLAMVFLAGEVVVDYSLRLKREIGDDRIWINSYANDIPCYIPSLRILKEGGYEAEGAMIGYEKPSRFTEDVEEKVMEGIYSILPRAYK